MSPLIVLSTVLLCGAFHQTQGLRTVINDGELIITTTVVNGTELNVVLTGETPGYIGFGISPGGSMTGADIVMAGFADDTQEPYAVDFTGTGNTRPTQDLIQNVEVVSASQNSTHTTVEFNRPLESDDADQDLPINSGPVNVIWSLGSSDSLSQYHNTRRGVVVIDILGDQ